MVEKQVQRSLALSDAQRILVRNRHQFAKYEGVAEVGVERWTDGQIYFVITCRSMDAVEGLPTIHAIDGLPVRIEIEGLASRAAAGGVDGAADRVV